MWITISQAKDCVLLDFTMTMYTYSFSFKNGIFFSFVTCLSHFSGGFIMSLFTL